MQVADTLLKKVQAPSTILLMTDAISEEDAVLLSNFVHGSVHRLEIVCSPHRQGPKYQAIPPY